MAIGPTADVSSMSADSLYDLYFAVAKQDHAFRMRSQYGNVAPPKGHCVFRPLTREHFTARLAHYDTLQNGRVGRSLRTRLSRQAFAYGVVPATPIVKKAA